MMKAVILLIFEFLGFAGFLFFLYLRLRKPIRYNRIFFSNKHIAKAMLLAIAFVVCCVLSCGAVNQVFKIWSPYELVDWDNKFGADLNDVVSGKTSIKDTSTIIDSGKCDTDTTTAAVYKKINIDTAFTTRNLYSVLCQFMDPGNLPSAKNNSRLWAVILAFIGIFLLSGIVVSSFVSFLTKKSERWRKGLLYYSRNPFKRGKYIVIVGVNELTAAIVKHSIKAGRDVIIQTRQDVEKMRERLDLSLDDDEEGHIIFYYGELTSELDIKRLYPEDCDNIYILGDDLECEDEKDHDSYNIKCVEIISTLVDVTDKQLRCHVNFEYQGTFTAFKATHHYLELKKKIIFIPFNVHNIWAKKILVDNFAIIPGKKKGELDVQRYLPIDSYRDKDHKTQFITKDSVGDNAKSVHVVIVGMNQMGTAFGMQTALMAHYPNFKYDHNLRTTITFIDEHAKAEGEYLRGRFEALFSLCRYRVVNCDRKAEEGEKERKVGKINQTVWTDPLECETVLGKFDRFGYLGKTSESSKGECNFMDLQWEFIQGNIACEEITEYLLDITSDTRKTTTIAICFNDPQQSIAAALYLPGQVVRQVNQILVYQQNSFDLINKVATGEKDWRRYSNMFPFGMIDGSYTGDELENSAAKIQNYLFSHNGQKGSLLGFDNSLIKEIEENWEERGMILRQSNIDLVDSYQSKIRSMGVVYKGNPLVVRKVLRKDRELVYAMSYSEHLRWVTQKLIGGFRPLSREEADIFNGISSEERSSRKDYFKRKKRAHLDICSYERLGRIDPDALHNDEDVIVNIPLILRCTEWINRKNYQEHIDKLSNKDKRSDLVAGLKFIRKKRTVKYKFNNKCKKVKLRHPRWMSDAPVSAKQWYDLTGKDKPEKGKEDFPVVNVSKHQIEDFLLILRKRTGLYFALPSIKEWACAARLSTASLDFSDEKKLSKSICFAQKNKPNTMRRNKSMAAHQKNDLGVYDMLGNVWEWTRTEVPDHNNCFYFCGGSYRFLKMECNMDKEYWYTYWAPSLASHDLGFRVVWKSDIKESTLCKGNEENVAIDRAKYRAKAWLNDYSHWVKIGQGYFIMGAVTEKCGKKITKDRYAEPDEGPMHFVKLDAFEICSVPVTQELWNDVNGKDYRNNPSFNIGSDKPQTNISYNDAKEFIKKLNDLDADYDYRLPTEAEWEYAAKGGHDSDAARAINDKVTERDGLSGPVLIEEDIMKLPGYYIYAGSNDPEKVAWYNEESTQPVAKKKPLHIADPESGEDQKLYDMSGNIWEWIEDKYQADFYGKCMDGKEYKERGYISNPLCRDSDYSAHVFRGGSYLFDERECRCTRPNYWVDSDSDVDLGFRLVRVKKMKAGK